MQSGRGDDKNVYTILGDWFIGLVWWKANKCKHAGQADMKLNFLLRCVYVSAGARVGTVSTLHSSLPPPKLSRCSVYVFTWHTTISLLASLSFVLFCDVIGQPKKVLRLTGRTDVSLSVNLFLLVYRDKDSSPADWPSQVVARVQMSNQTLFVWSRIIRYLRALYTLH